jgi:membrane protease YdiL (CAAX protease family)
MARSSRREHRTTLQQDWRHHRAIPGWDALSASAYLGLLGVGVAATAAVNIVDPTMMVGTHILVLWVFLVLATVLAFSRGRPAGLLAVRPSDMVVGVLAGMLLRVAQGYLTNASERPFPSLSELPTGFVSDPFWGPASIVVLGAFIEEIFFRGLLLVPIFCLVRGRAGTWAAAWTSTSVSTIAFVLTHTAFAGNNLHEVMQLSVISITCVTLVLMTGRILPAVAVHLTYNLTFLLIAAMGSYFA